MRQRDEGGEPMVARKKKHAKILDLIPTGRGNAISMKDLARILEVDVRGVRQLVHNARNDGEVICGTESGYYQPATKEELRDYIALAQSRAFSCLRSLKAARKLLSEMEKKDE